MIGGIALTAAAAASNIAHGTASTSSTIGTNTATVTTVVSDEQQQQLPVLIVGAGPCGLVAAATLQKHGIPFVIIEKASRSKICSNAGAGFELASTAIGILRDRLSIDPSKIMSEYVGMAMMTLGNRNIRDSRLPGRMSLASVNRAEMQKHLLDEVLFSGVGPKKEQEEDGVLICGSGIDSYREEEDGRVVATLVSDSDDTDHNKKTIVGCALLACDGIHSRCRAVMHSSDSGSNDNDYDYDPLHFCNAIYYWGKTPVPDGSELEKEFLKTQKYHKEGCSAVIAVGTSNIPGAFFLIPTKNSTVLVWGVVVRSKEPPTRNDTSSSLLTQNNNDSTRRGGGVLTEEGKERLFPSGSSSSILGRGNSLPILRKLIEHTPANDITEAGLFDRENIDLPYSSPKKLVALLGGE